MKTNQLLTGLAMISVMGLAACGGAASHETTEGEAVMNTKENALEETHNINLEASKVMWKGTMINVYSHEGTLDFTEGELTTKGNQITGGSFTIDMTSMQPTDGNYKPEEGKTPEKLVGHLSAPEFFDIANHRTAKFQISSSKDGKLMGELTLKGVTHEETVENVSYDEATNTYAGVMTVDRKKYGVSWDSPMKEMVLSNDLQIKVNLVL